MNILLGFSFLFWFLLSLSRCVVVDRFGPTHDDVGFTGVDDESECTDLAGFGFKFYEEPITQFCVSDNGLLSWNSPNDDCCPPSSLPAGAPIIAVWWEDADMYNGPSGSIDNTVWRRATSDQADIDHFLNQIGNPPVPVFDPDYVLVATWFLVEHIDGGEYATFQTAVLVDQSEDITIAILNYELIEWLDGYGDALVGFEGFGDQSWEFPFSGSGAPGAADAVLAGSSCGLPAGRYVFRIDTDPIQPDFCECPTIIEHGGVCATHNCTNRAYCSGHGHCTAPDVCECIPGWFNTECTEQYTCPALGECNGHGVCIGADVCDCSEFAPQFAGPACDLTSCRNSPVSSVWYTQGSPGICNGRGTCVAFDTCQCSGQLVGNWCLEKAECDGWDYDHVNACGGRGTCLTTDSCECNGGYTGTFCEKQGCWNVSSDSGDVCSGKGVCFGIDRCYCDSRYHGRMCSEYVEDELLFVTRLSTEDDVFAFLPYVVRARDVRPEQSPAGSIWFNCTSLLRAESFPFIPLSCIAAWVLDTSDTSLTIGLNISISDVSTNIHWRVSGRFELLFIPATADSIYEFFELTVMYTVQLPEGPPITPGAALKPATVAAIVVSVVFLLVVAGIVILVLVLYFRCQVKRQKEQLSHFGELDNFDIVLQEQKAAKESGMQNIKVNKALSLIPYDSIFLEKTIGAGGSGAVIYKAQWEGRVCAFKVFKMTHGADMIESFEREVSIALSVRHPNVLRIFGSCVQLPRVGIVMEYCQYGELRAFFQRCLLRSIHLSIATKLRMIYEIASATAYLHGHDIIHRDLKCENVLIDDRVSCRLIDFGLSRLIADSDAGMRMTNRVGTSYYMAPEVTLGESSYNSKVDIFSIGIMIWEIISCCFEPYGTNLDSIEVRVATDPNLRPAFWASEVREEVQMNFVEGIIPLMKECWAHASKDRPAAGVVARKLGELCQKCDAEELPTFVMHEDEDGELIAVPSVHSRSRSGKSADGKGGGRGSRGGGRNLQRTSSSPHLTLDAHHPPPPPASSRTPPPAIPSRAAPPRPPPPRPSSRVPPPIPQRKSRPTIGISAATLFDTPSTDPDPDGRRQEVAVGEKPSDAYAKEILHLRTRVSGLLKERNQHLTQMANVNRKVKELERELMEWRSVRRFQE